MNTKQALWLLIGFILISPYPVNGLSLLGWFIVAYTTYKIYITEYDR